MRVELLNGDHPRWSEILTRLSHDFYHRPAYARIEGRRIQAVPEVFLATEGEKLFFLPYLLRSCAWLAADGEVPDGTADVTSPYGYPGIVLSEAGRDPDFACQALEALGQTLAAKGVCSAFFRMHPLLNADVPALFAAGVFTATGKTVAIDLHQDETVLWRGVRHSHRRCIEKCRHAGHTARMVPLQDYLEDFLACYYETMQRVRAKPSYYFDRDYFQELARVRDGVFCGIVESQGRVAAAGIFFECDGITQAHLGGTRAGCLAHSPDHLLLYEAALWAKNRGNRFFHLGGGLGGADDTLLLFKAGFSHLRFPFFTLRLITNEKRYLQMVNLKARAVRVPPEQLLASGFFPAYRDGDLSSIS